MLKNRKALTEAQEVLLVDVEERFDAAVNETDIAILYEVTGFKPDLGSRFLDDFIGFEATESLSEELNE